MPQQSEIHVHVCLTTIGIVTYRAQNDNVHTVALFLYIYTMYIQEFILSMN